MKYFALIGVLAVLVMTGTAAARPGGSNDGALSVKNADGRVIIVGKGVVIGRFDKGQVTIKDPNPYDATVPIVTGAEATQSIDDKTTRYSGTNLRFRMIGGSFTVNVFGTDIDLSAVGRGMVTLNGTIAKNTDATYAVERRSAAALPDVHAHVPLAPNASGG